MVTKIQVETTCRKLEVFTNLQVVDQIEERPLSHPIKQTIDIFN